MMETNHNNREVQWELTRALRSTDEPVSTEQYDRLNMTCGSSISLIPLCAESILEYLSI